jgi:polyhydroxyalkanoate synthesis regulator phasin
VQSARQPAIKWIDSTSPNLLASLTQPFIAYAEHFQTLAGNFAKDPAATSQHEAVRLVGLAANAQGAADAGNTALGDMITTLQGETKTLSDAISAAAADAGVEMAEVSKLDDRINALRQKVSAAAEDLNAPANAAAFSSVSLEFGLIGFGYAVATSGMAVIPFTGIVAAAAGITVSSIVSGEKAEGIAKDLVEIGNLQMQVAEAGQMIAGLTQLGHQLEDVHDAIGKLQSGLSLKPLWEDVLKEAHDIQQLVGDPGQRDAVAKALKDAATVWSKISGMAQTTQNATTTQSPEQALSLGSTLPAQTSLRGRGPQAPASEPASDATPKR